ncbi:MAG: DUF2891 domain-containing protein [Acidobacteria bacterium]|nr:DUF2891 domain-containing protein [Acidobacteriota bacterium]
MRALQLDPAAASRFAQLALKCIEQEFPNKPSHVMHHEREVTPPRDQHPAFYGCFDWHSAVHGHWLLVRVLKLFPELPEAPAIRDALDRNLTKANLLAEAAYIHQKGRASFERTYGWAWLLKLVEELHTWDDADAARWRENLRPLEQALVERYLEFFPKQTYAIRTGVHPNTAFGLAFALDYARGMGQQALSDLVVERSRTYYLADADCPAGWEPGGNDFFSPCLMEADLMRRVLPRAEFITWFTAFLPELAQNRPASLLEPAVVTDRSDGQLVHLDGLNLSRAWCMANIAAALPANHPAHPILWDAAFRHAEDALQNVHSGDYAGEHWLASFAVYLLSSL